MVANGRCSIPLGRPEMVANGRCSIPLDRPEMVANGRCSIPLDRPEMVANGRCSIPLGRLKMVANGRCSIPLGRPDIVVISARHGGQWTPSTPLGRPEMMANGRRVPLTHQNNTLIFAYSFYLRAVTEIKHTQKVRSLSWSSYITAGLLVLQVSGLSERRSPFKPSVLSVV